jgi:hypothetical protein
MNTQNPPHELAAGEPDHDQAKPKPPIKQGAEVLHVYLSQINA